MIHAVEGWGKTSLGAHFPKPIFIQTKGETGLETLIDANRLGEVPHFPETQTWEEMLGCIETLTLEDHPYKTLVIDTANGAERLCHEMVCIRDYKNNFGKEGFCSYMQGFEVSLADWRKLLSTADTLRITRMMTILLLCHTKVKPFKNPEGADFDRYQPDMHEKTWGLTHKWADVVLFGNFSVTVKGASGDAIDPDRPKKGKAYGGQQRMLYTERHAAYDAKNRLGLVNEIEMGGNAQESWQKLYEAVKAGKESNPNG